MGVDSNPKNNFQTKNFSACTFTPANSFSQMSAFLLKFQNKISKNFLLLISHNISNCNLGPDESFEFFIMIGIEKTRGSTALESNVSVKALVTFFNENIPKS